MKVAKFSSSEYFMGRDKSHSQDLTEEVKANADNLLNRVNALLADLNWPSPAYVSSGWRPPSINASVANSAKRSHHMSGRAMDIKDPDGRLAKAILERPELLEKHGLWMEDPSFTKGWVHLDTGTRSARKVRVFKP
jgi:uncharacterized protein YcbK (DUF882 family)